MLHSTDVPLTTVLSILAIVDIVGNCLVCAIIKQNPVMRYVESEMHVFNNDILHALNKGVKANNNRYKQINYLREGSLLETEITQGLRGCM